MKIVLDLFLTLVILPARQLAALEAARCCFPALRALSCLIPGCDGHFGCPEWGA